MTATISTVKSGPLAQFTFPRTGKRGVPQQFPRRLYEMLDTETRRISSAATGPYPKVISWSKDGTSFYILDVDAFSETVLPKYFRTKKFSSFQRNLNLYGFTKVRRGPGSNIYAHPSFLKDQPESLMSLRKISPSARGSDASILPPVSKRSGVSEETRREKAALAAALPSSLASTTARAVSPSQLSNHSGSGSSHSASSSSPATRRTIAKPVATSILPSPRPASEPPTAAAATAPNHIVLLGPGGLAQYALINMAALATANAANVANLNKVPCPANAESLHKAHSHFHASTQGHSQPNMSPTATVATTAPNDSLTSSNEPEPQDRGNLDLLALAMERELAA